LNILISRQAGYPVMLRKEKERKVPRSSQQNRKAKGEKEENESWADQ